MKARARTPHLVRFAWCPLLIWFVATCSSRGLSASTIIVTVIGTVDSGTDGNPDSNPRGAGSLFGAGSDLSGEPFTLTLTFDDLEGISSFSSCSDGTLSQSNNTGSSVTAHPSAVLQIGLGGYLFSAYTLQNIDWNIYRGARTSCTSYNEVSFGWSETYAGDYRGGAGFGMVGLYASNSAAFSGDWRSLVPPTSVDPVDFQFNISASQVGSQNEIAYAYGYLKATIVTVSQPAVTCANLPLPIALRPRFDVVSPDAIVDCQQKLSELAQALRNFDDRLGDILQIVANGETPDNGHLKALRQAAVALRDALNLVTKYCAGVAGAAALIAGAEAALEAAGPYIAAFCFL